MRKTSQVGWGALLCGGLIAGGLIVFSQHRVAPDERARDAKELAASLRRLLARIASALRVPVPKLALSRNVDNAASDGRRILINPDWARRTLATYCADQDCGYAVMIGVLGHELIHHVYGDVNTLKAQPWLRRDCEARADEGAGIALALLGVTPDHFARVAYHITNRNSGEYPSPGQRVAIIRSAFERTRAPTLALAA